MKRFIENQSGNFAVILSLVALPVMLTIGAAVDYSGVSKKRSDLQNSIDSAILAVGQDFDSMNNREIRKKLNAYLQANLTTAEYQQISKIFIDKDMQERSLTVTARAKFSTSFMMLAGVKEIDYNAVSQIKSASGGAEIALVLDTTGSMSVDGKLDALKTAAGEFVEKIMVKDTGGKTKIGIVPFSDHVNVGMSNRNASWLEVEADSTVTEPNYCYMTRDVVSKTNCRTVNASSPETGPYTYEQCDYTYGPEYEVCGPRTTSTSWRGCVGSRNWPLNLEDRNYNKRVPGLMDVSCGAPVLSLTDKKATVKSTINALVASGNTYIPAGLTWGMRVLSKGQPFSGGVSAAEAKKKEIKKFLILMTDGDNTRSAQLPDDPAHWGSDYAEANDWTAKACDNIRKDEISIYSITFGTLTDETKALVQGCASEPGQYYHAVTGKDLSEAFDDIYAKITSLHLSM